MSATYQVAFVFAIALFLFEEAISTNFDGNFLTRHDIEDYHIPDAFTKPQNDQHASRITRMNEFICDYATLKYKLETATDGAMFFLCTEEIKIEEEIIIKANAVSIFCPGEDGNCVLHHIKRGRIMNIDGDDFMVYGVAFHNANNEKGVGGALRIKGKGINRVENCVFKNNRARYGGGVFSRKDTITEIKNSKFIGNFARADGGAAYFASEANIDLLGNIGSGNEAARGCSDFYHPGKKKPKRGTCENFPLPKIGCVSTYELLRERTEAASNEDRIILCPGTIIVEDEVSVKANDVSISCSGAVGSCALYKRNLQNNTHSGRIVESSGFSITLSGISFQNANTGEMDGGAVRIMGGGHNTVKNCIFRNNKARNGGGLYATDDGVTKIFQSKFINNIAKEKGAGAYVIRTEGIELARTNRIGFNDTFDYGDDDDNPFDCDGVFVERSQTCEDDRDDGNTCLTDYISLKQTLEGANNGDYVTICPGVINIHEEIYVNASAVFIQCDGQWGSCTLEKIGHGRIFNFRNTGITLDGIKFANGLNLYSNGGAVYMGGNDPYLKYPNTIVGCTFEHNSARNGGGVYTEDTIQTNIIDTTFTSNSASRQGGSAYTAFMPNNVNICNSGTDNYAKQCGGIYGSNSGSCNGLRQNCFEQPLSSTNGVTKDSVVKKAEEETESLTDSLEEKSHNQIENPSGQNENTFAGEKK